MVVLHQEKQIHQVHNPSLSALAFLLVMPSSGTSNLNRRGIMKKSILIVLASIFLSYPMNLIGGDFDPPHTFSCGDTISADMMNEIFDYIKNANKMITASELLGTWSCEVYTQTSGCAAYTSLGTDSLYRYNSTTLVMTDDNDGTYSYTSTIPNIFNCADNATGLGNWVIKNNTLFVDVYKWGIKGDPSVEAQLGFAKLKKVSNTKILMESEQAKTIFAECDRQNLPPTTPATLTASASGTTVSLAWSDNSTNETNFNVLRRDSCDGSFSIVDNVTENETSSTDTVPAAGSYWYRVSATNDNGTSVPSKMVRVDVE
jgi:hypothetical protein